MSWPKTFRPTTNTAAVYPEDGIPNLQQHRQRDEGLPDTFVYVRLADHSRNRQWYVAEYTEDPSLLPWWNTAYPDARKAKKVCYGYTQEANTATFAYFALTGEGSIPKSAVRDLDFTPQLLGLVINSPGIAVHTTQNGQHILVDGVPVRQLPKR